MRHQMALSHSNYTNIDPDIQLESDIADEHYKLDHDEDLPPRPTSRLGFNTTGEPDATALKSPIASPPTRPRAGALKWTKSLLQKIKIPSLASSSVDADMDIDIAATPLALSSADEDKDIDLPSLPSLPSLASASTSTSSLNLTDMDVDSASEHSYDSDSEDYSSGSGDSDVDVTEHEQSDGLNLGLFKSMVNALAPPPDVPPTSLPPIPYSVIIPSTVPPSCSLPPVTPALFSPPIERTKYSSLPSPLSSTASRSPCTKPPRHCYGHHGRSRHALLHLKYLWALREDQWDEHASRMRDAYAYSGISPPKTPPPLLQPRHPSPPLEHAQSAGPVPVPPMTIHPRRGDLSALRDPYGEHMDRCFVGMPLWTMSKTLWMYDVHMLAGWRASQEKDQDNEPKAVEGTSSDDESENEGMSSSMSTAGFSDDSEATLVESEGERSEDELEVLEEIDLRETGGDDIKAPVSSRSCPACVKPSDASYGSLWTSGPRWNTSWYKRWEILIELVRLDTERERERQTTRQTFGLVSRPPRFFIGESESAESGTWDDYDDDDVLIISN